MPSGYYISSELAKDVLAFRDERDWAQFHNPKDLAISLSLEAAELLEVFQWSAGDTGTDGRLDRIAEELADVFNYAILMADACGLDAETIIRDKLMRNGEKYPAAEFRGSRRKYNERKAEG